MEVGGDEWNRQTAQRLETEYAAVRPDIDRIAQEAVDQEVEVSGGSPGSWDEVSEEAQEAAADKYYGLNYDSNYDSEVESWHENGDALNDAKRDLADDGDWKAEWLSDFLSGNEDDAHPIPYTAGQLLDAIEIHADDDGGDPIIDFNNDFLSEPSDLDPNWNANQATLPGIDVKPAAGHDHLTEAMRDEIRKALIEAFNEEAEKKSSDVETPEYIAESAKEQTQNQWEEMSDEDKYQWTKDNTQLIEDSEGNDDDVSRTVEMPAKFDPLNETSGEDYKRTQALAKYVSDHRAAQLITDRVNAGLIGQPKGEAKLAWNKVTSKNDWVLNGVHYATEQEANAAVNAPKDAAWTERMLQAVQSIDNQLWSGWKGSSTGVEGRILQVAAADELGGRLREATPTRAGVDATATALAAMVYDDPKSTDAQKVDAKKIIDEAGGLEAAQALVKATKIMGDKDASQNTTNAAKTLINAFYKNAPPEVIKAYAMNLDTIGGKGNFPIAAADIIYNYEVNANNAARAADKSKEAPILKSETVDGYIRLPDVNIVRNGAASTTVSRDVANGWGGTVNNVPSGIDRREVIDYANQEFKNIGGYDGVKAAIRAKWETTQYLLDRADMPVVQVYRGINMEHRPDVTTSQKGEFNPPTSGMVSGYKVGHGDPSDMGPLNLKDFDIGAVLKIASGKTITKDSAIDPPGNKGSGIGTWTYDEAPTVSRRIVLRAEVPRTAVISVPAYGVNVKSEQEVVVVGTAWRDWDAWSGRAPSFTEVPLHTKRTEDTTAAFDKWVSDNATQEAAEMAGIDKLVTELKQKKAA